MSSPFLPFLSFLGLVNALFVRIQHKRYEEKGKKFFCLFEEDCTKVISSKYGKTLGVKNEVFGIFFYSAIFLFFILGLFISIPKIYLLALAATIFAAAFFSIYLLYIQTAILKKFCSWCLIAIIINFLLLITYFLSW